MHCTMPGMTRFLCRGRGVSLAIALERGSGIDIGLLQLDAPIAQILERNGAPSDGAAHEITRRHDLHLSVEISELGFALEANVAFESVHHGWLARIMSKSFQSP